MYFCFLVHVIYLNPGGERRNSALYVFERTRPVRLVLAGGDDVRCVCARGRRRICAFSSQRIFCSIRQPDPFPPKTSTFLLLVSATSLFLACCRHFTRVFIHFILRPLLTCTHTRTRTRSPTRSPTRLSRACLAVAPTAANACRPLSRCCVCVFASPLRWAARLRDCRSCITRVRVCFALHCVRFLEQIGEHGPFQFLETFSIR